MSNFPFDQNYVSKIFKAVFLKSNINSTKVSWVYFHFGDNFAIRGKFLMYLDVIFGLKFVCFDKNEADTKTKNEKYFWW